MDKEERYVETAKRVLNCRYRCHRRHKEGKERHRMEEKI